MMDGGSSEWRHLFLLINNKHSSALEMRARSCNSHPAPLRARSVARVLVCVYGKPFCLALKKPLACV